MRRNSVVIKSNAYGLILYLDPDVTFGEILEETGKKFRDSARFFRNAQMALTFRGRDLSDEEQLALVEQITDNAQIQILCLVDESHGQQEQEAKDAVTRALDDLKGGAAQLYFGTLPRGKTLESEKSIVVMGDVNPGACVYSGGSIIVMGTLMGEAGAGLTGLPGQFVAALVFLPKTLKIGDKVARSAITKHDNPGDYPIDPKVAFLKDGRIQIEKLRSDALNHIRRAAEQDKKNAPAQDGEGEN